MTGIEYQSDLDALRANVLEEIAHREPERVGQQIIPRLEALEVKLDQIIAGNYYNIAVRKLIL